MNAVEFPSHEHPLKLIDPLLPGEEDEGEERSGVYIKKEEEEEGNGVCGLCGETVKGSRYECSECNFAAHLGCAENPPSLVIKESKIHQHTLTLLPRQVSFTCNACGFPGHRSPYVCLKCSFMVHKTCIDYPRVLNINRHDHRLSYTSFLGPGDWTCGVCRERMDRKYGGFICHRCVNYAVHSKCATRTDVWEGKELEGVPEDQDYETMIFVIDENSVRHASHEHSLRLMEEEFKYRDDVCSGCALPIGSQTFYRCDDLCDFFIHERCAHLPLTKTTFLHVHPLTLSADKRSGPNGISRCHACDLQFSGFKYRCLECKDDNIEFDIQCSLISEPFVNQLHPHPLFFINLGTNDNEEEAKICNFCNHQGPKYALSCIECDFHVCFACATLPHEVFYKYDEHLLTPTIGEDVTTNPNWCDICENKMDLKRNYYECLKCGPVLHTDCAVGSFRNMRPGLSFTSHGHEYQVIINDRTSILRCSHCHTDCHEPLLLMATTTTTDGTTIYLCSSTCFTAYVSV